MQNYKAFAFDSLFCEYAYVLNLDEGTLDFFKGFNKEKAEKSIFFDSEKDELQKPDHREDMYYPITKAESFTFEEIKERGVDEIIYKMKVAAGYDMEDEE